MIITHHITSDLCRLHDVVAIKLRDYLRSSNIRCLIVGCSNQPKIDDRAAIEDIVEHEQTPGLHLIHSDEISPREIQQTLRDLEYGEKLVLLCDSDDLHHVIKQFNHHDYELIASPRSENFVAVKFDVNAADMALAS